MQKLSVYDTRMLLLIMLVPIATNYCGTFRRKAKPNEFKAKSMSYKLYVLQIVAVDVYRKDSRSHAGSTRYTCVE